MSADNQGELLGDAASRPLAQPLAEHLNYGMQEPRLHEVPGISGLYYFPEFLNSVTQREVMGWIDHGDRKDDWCEDLKRRVLHYGWRYDYRAKTTNERLGRLPEIFAKIAGRLAMLWLPDGTRLFNQAPDQVLVNEYDNSRPKHKPKPQGIALHTDRTDCFDRTVATISLGDDWEMKLQPAGGTPNQARRIMLVRGSALIMTGDARFKWKHGIQPRKYEKTDENGGRRERQRRLSLTFRTMLGRDSKDSGKSLRETMQEISRNAQRRGLAPEILQSILDEECPTWFSTRMSLSARFYN